jgi:hypothetical protein
MPNFVAVFKVFKNGIVEEAVSVGDEAYFKHVYRKEVAEVIKTDREKEPNNVAHIMLFSRYFFLILRNTAIAIKINSINI